jgi:hypothetical protein
LSDYSYAPRPVVGLVVHREIYTPYVGVAGMLLHIKYMLSGHSAAQEIKHLRKLTSGFIGPQILNFKRSFSLSPGLQSSFVPPCIISLGGPEHGLLNQYDFVHS